MRKFFPILALFTVTACAAPQPAPVMQLGSKYYGRGSASQPSASPAHMATTSPSARGEPAYYDNSTYQAAETPSISVKDTSAITPQTSFTEPTKDSYYAKPQTSSSNEPQGNLRWQSGATELEKSYKFRSAEATPPAPEKLEKLEKIEENPLQSALEAEEKQAKKSDIRPQTSAKLSRFIWPAKGKIITRFGTEQHGVKNDGICIAMPEGTTVQSAAGGTVIYVGDELAGFGNLVIVRHAGDWVSAYGHNQQVMVSRGDKVAQGQVIALSGATGDVVKPQLYLSIRKGKEPVDPLRLLEENNSLGKGKLDLAMQGDRI